VNPVSAQNKPKPASAQTISGACSFVIPEGWKIDRTAGAAGKDDHGEPSPGFAALTPASWPWTGASNAPRPFIQVYEIPGPVPSAALMKSAGPKSQFAATAMLLLEHMGAERGVKVKPVRSEMRNVSGMFGWDVAATLPGKEGPLRMEECFVLAERQDSYFAVVACYDTRLAAQSGTAFSQVVNSLRPIRTVPRHVGGDLAAKLEYLKKALAEGNATETAPWNMEVLSVSLHRPTAGAGKDELLVFLRFRHQDSRTICRAWQKCLDDVKTGQDPDATDDMGRFTELMSAHAGLLSQEVVRQDVGARQVLFVIYGSDQGPIAAYRTDLNVWRRVLQGQGGGGKELFESWSYLAADDIRNLPPAP
jgi:hypothetical protein